MYVEYSIKLMHENSMKYLGIPNYVFESVSESLKETTTISGRDLMIVLRKIRLDETFEILSDVFGLSFQRISQVFNARVPSIAAELEELVFWPNRSDIQKFMPVAFLHKYSNIESIIDCFEIQIQKPHNPIWQSVTYSSYKSCNTIKYLISCTPCGQINFISKGFPGRASDQKIVNKSGYLEHIKEGCGVLADRGFKNIAGDVSRKGGLLIRPPSVSQDDTLTKEEAMLAKEIAAVRIHVERLIRRIREYSICAPHATVPSCFF